MSASQEDAAKKTAFERISKAQNHYETLGVSQNATPQEIRAAFKAQAMLVHPDKNKDNPEAAKEATQKLIEANKVLSDATARATYDESLKKAQAEKDAAAQAPAAQQEQPAKPTAAKKEAPKEKNKAQHWNETLADLFTPAETKSDDPQQQMMQDLLKWVMSVNLMITNAILGKVFGSPSAPTQKTEKSTSDTPESGDKKPVLSGLSDTATTATPTKLITQPSTSTVTPVDQQADPSLTSRNSSTSSPS